MVEKVSSEILELSNKQKIEKKIGGMQGNSEPPSTPSIRRKTEGTITSVRATKLNIGMVGNSNVGKTSLIRRFVYGANSDAMSKHTTIGVDQF